MTFVDFAVNYLKQFVKVHYSGVSRVLEKCGGIFQGIWTGADWERNKWVTRNERSGKDRMPSTFGISCNQLNTLGSS